MSAKANYFKIGLFSLGALLIVVAFVLALGASSWFTPMLTCETYVNESVQGLDLGSKVKYRGVQVGEVSAVGFSYTEYQTDLPITERERYVLIQMKINPKLLGGTVRTLNAVTFGNEIARGLRCRIAAQGITGVMYLELDYVKPADYAALPVTWTPQHQYIPSVPSTVTHLMERLDVFMKRVGEMPVETTFSNLNNALVSVNSMLNQMQLSTVSSNVVGLVVELRSTTREFEKWLNNPEMVTMRKDVAGSAAAFRKLLEDPSISQSLALLQDDLLRLNQLLGGNEQEVGLIVDNLRQVSGNLRDLSENAKRYPSGVLFGAPPPAVK